MRYLPLNHAFTLLHLSSTLWQTAPHVLSLDKLFHHSLPCCWGAGEYKRTIRGGIVPAIAHGLDVAVAHEVREGVAQGDDVHIAQQHLQSRQAV